MGGGQQGGLGGNRTGIHTTGTPTVRSNLNQVQRGVSSEGNTLLPDPRQDQDKEMEETSKVYQRTVTVKSGTALAQPLSKVFLKCGVGRENSHHPRSPDSLERQHRPSLRCSGTVSTSKVLCLLLREAG